MLGIISSYVLFFLIFDFKCRDLKSC